MTARSAPRLRSDVFANRYSLIHEKSLNDWVAGTAQGGVEDGTLFALDVKGGPNGIDWTEKILADGSLYLVVSDPACASNLLATARAESPVTTEEGRARASESYLKGRRRTTE